MILSTDSVVVTPNTAVLLICLLHGVIRCWKVPIINQPCYAAAEALILNAASNSDSLAKLRGQFQV